MQLSCDHVFPPGNYVLATSGYIAGFPVSDTRVLPLASDTPLAGIVAGMAQILVASHYYLRPGDLKSAELRKEGDIQQINLRFG